MCLRGVSGLSAFVCGCSVKGLVCVVTFDSCSNFGIGIVIPVFLKRKLMPTEV